jgi:hypothetical protein
MPLRVLRLVMCQELAAESALVEAQRSLDVVDCEAAVIEGLDASHSRPSIVLCPVSSVSGTNDPYPGWFVDLSLTLRATFVICQRRSGIRTPGHQPVADGVRDSDKPDYRAACGPSVRVAVERSGRIHSAADQVGGAVRDGVGTDL